MYCPFCGQQNTAATGRCAHCGQSLQPYAGAQSPTYQRRPDIPTYLVQAILVTMFCCQPFGIVAIVYAALTTSKISSGDYAAAMECSRNAEKWCWLAFWLGLIPMLLYAIFIGVGIASGSMH